MLGIIWIMVNMVSLNSYAEASFTKSQPIGIMSTAVKREIAVSWEVVKGADGYAVYEAVDGEGSSYHWVQNVKKSRVILREKQPGKEYFYYVRAYRVKGNGKKSYSRASKKVSTTVAAEGISTIKNLLQTALAPIGSTMYVWGGGWNKADTGAGKDARRIGLSPAWRAFAKNKKASYNYKRYRYRVHQGLDCSGYVGWCIYNVRNTSNNQKGYVYSASKQAGKLAASGFGSYRSAKLIKDYCAGDVMSSTCKCCGHVWIVIGQCKDGSVVLVHSSPPGIQLCGTETPSGKKNSKACKLAKKYMKQYYRAWYERYPNVCRGKTYLSHYGQMRWKTTGKNICLSDPDGYQNMSAEEVLADLYE